MASFDLRIALTCTTIKTLLCFHNHFCTCLRIYNNIFPQVLIKKLWDKEMPAMIYEYHAQSYMWNSLGATAYDVTHTINNSTSV